MAAEHCILLHLTHRSGGEPAPVQAAYQLAVVGDKAVELLVDISERASRSPRMRQVATMNRTPLPRR